MVPKGETIIERKVCPLSGETFYVTDVDRSFLDTISPIIGGKKYLIPNPTLAPIERMKRRFCWRNERSLYRNICQASGKEVTSIYAPEKGIHVYTQSSWWNDQWDPRSYAQDFSFSQTMHQNLNQLRKQVPYPHANIKNSENCEYTNYMLDSNNCYMAFACSWSENIFYSNWTTQSSNCIDCSMCSEIQNCYELVDCQNCSHMHHSIKCSNCSECHYCYDLIGCHNCLFSHHLRNKKHYIFNKQVSQKEFEEAKDQLSKMSPEKAWEQFQKMYQESPHIHLNNIKCENVVGNNLIECSDCYECFGLMGAQNCRYCAASAGGQKNCMDCSGSCGEYGYESLLAVRSYMTLFTVNCAFSSHVYYSDSCLNGVKDCLLCVGLHNAESNCILNKPYSKAEYEKKAGRIIDHMCSTKEWGEFFQPNSSPFGYNETYAFDYLPESQKTLQEKQYNWFEQTKKPYTGNIYVPKDISNYDEKHVGPQQAKQNISDCLKGILICEDSKRPYKITKNELAFYIENKQQIPRKCFEQRHLERLSFIQPYQLYSCKCSSCKSEINTAYPEKENKKITCQDCYQNLLI